MREQIARHVIETPATASQAVRKAAATNQGVDATRAAFVATVTKWAYKVTDEDVAALKTAGVAEDEIFELAVCAALGESGRQLDAAMAALDAATPTGRPGT